MLLATMGNTFLENDFEHFRSTISLVRPPTGSDKAHVAALNRFDRDFARSVRLVSASLAFQNSHSRP